MMHLGYSTQRRVDQCFRVMKQYPLEVLIYFSVPLTQLHTLLLGMSVYVTNCREMLVRSVKIDVKVSVGLIGRQPQLEALVLFGIGCDARIQSQRELKL